MSVEYGTLRRSDPFPARWGTPPGEEQRTAWAVAHIRAETTERTNTRRRAELLRRRYDPEDSGAA